MKQLILKFTGKKFITAAFISASVLLTSFSGNATSGNATPGNSIIEILEGGNSKVEFTGSTSDALLFNVQINNANADNFTLTIKSEDGNILYSKAFNNVDFDKQIKILKGEEQGTRYYFTVTSSNKTLENTFVINSSTRVIDDVTINKL